MNRCLSLVHLITVTLMGTSKLFFWRSKPHAEAQRGLLPSKFFKEPIQHATEG